MFQVFWAPEGKGWGLRTLEALPRGAFVCEYVGEIVTINELHERNSPSLGKEYSYRVLLDADWGSQDVLKDEKALCLDSTVYGNVARFINHRYKFIFLYIKLFTPLKCFLVVNYDLLGLRFQVIDLHFLFYTNTKVVISLGIFCDSFLGSMTSSPEF